MENKQGTSFIPKSPTRASTKPVGVRRVFILTYVTSIFFFGTIIAAIAIFVWGSTTDSQLSKTKQLLEDKRADFNQASLEQVREVEARLTAASSLLNRQVSVASIFTALEDSIYLPVQVTGFEYAKNDAGALDLALSVRSRTFNDALVQRNGLLENAVFSGATVSGPVFTNPVPPEDAPYLASKEVQYVIEKELSPTDIPHKAPEQSVSYESYTDTQGAIVETPSSDTSTDTENIGGSVSTETGSLPDAQPVDITDSISN